MKSIFKKLFSTFYQKQTDDANSNATDNPIGNLSEIGNDGRSNNATGSKDDAEKGSMIKPLLKFNRFGSVNIDDLVDYISSTNGVEGYINLSALTTLLYYTFKGLPEYEFVQKSDFKYSIIYCNEASYINRKDSVSEIIAVNTTNNGYKIIPIIIHSKMEGYLHYTSCIGDVNNDEKVHLFTLSPNPNDENGHSCISLDNYMYPVSLNLDSLEAGLYYALNDTVLDKNKPLTLIWFYRNGDLVVKGDIICKVITPLGKYNVICKNGGYIKIQTLDVPPIKDEATNQYNSIESSYDLYRIYKTENDLIYDEFESELDFVHDEFTGLGQTYWKRFAGINVTKYKGDAYFEMDNEDGHKIYMFPQYKDNKIVLVLGSNSKDFRISLGDQLILLFQVPLVNKLINNEKESSTFILSSEYFMLYHDLFDVAYSAEIEPMDLFRLANMKCIKWRLIPRTSNRTILEGVNESTWTANNISGEVFRLACWEFRDCLYKNGVITDLIPSTNSKVNEESTSIDTIGSESCYVYLMVDITNGYYKIGMSKDPHYRESTLQSEKPSIELVCAKKFPNRQIASSIEAALHKTYGNKNIRGEWFSLSEQDVTMLKATLA